MTPAHLAPPEPIELVSADELSALVAATDGAFQLLETRAAEATAAADHAEARADALGFEDRNAPEALEAMQRFITGWRAQVEAHADRLVDAARLGARVRIDEAHAEAERVRHARRSAPVVAPLTRPAEQPPVLATPEVDPVHDLVVAPPEVPETRVEYRPEPVSVVSPEPTAAPLAEPVLDGVPAPVDVIDDITPAAKSDNGTRPGPTPAGHDESVHLGAPGSVNGATSTLDAMAPAPAEALDDASAHDSEPTGTFWTEPPPPKRKGILRRIPVSAVLEVIAVLLILVFILLRLS